MKNPTIYNAQQHKALLDECVRTTDRLRTCLADMLFMFDGRIGDININTTEATFEFVGTGTKSHTITLTATSKAGCVILRRDGQSAIVQSDAVLSALHAAVDARDAFASYASAEALATVLATQQKHAA